MKKLILIFQAMCMLVCFSPAQSSALFLEGPFLNQDEVGWDLFGLLVRAEKDTVLLSVHYPNRGLEDQIEIRLHADGTVLCSAQVPAGENETTVTLDCSLTAGEVYEIVSTAMNNSYWTYFSNWPVGNDEITVLSSYGGASYGRGSYSGLPYTSFWFAFDGITTQLDQNIIVPIDIKPGSASNTVNLKSKGVVPVAILSTDTFDAASVDILTVVFGPDGAQEAHGKSHVEDINGDALPDLMLHFETQKTGIQCGDNEVSLMGMTYYGDVFEGSDAIMTVKCK
jgi:hypothetical protein